MGLHRSATVHALKVPPGRSGMIWSLKRKSSNRPRVKHQVPVRRRPPLPLALQPCCHPQPSRVLHTTRYRNLASTSRQVRWPPAQGTATQGPLPTALDGPDRPCSTQQPAALEASAAVARAFLGARRCCGQCRSTPKHPQAGQGQAGPSAPAPQKPAGRTA